MYKKYIRFLIFDLLREKGWSTKYNFKSLHEPKWGLLHRGHFQVVLGSAPSTLVTNWFLKAKKTRSGLIQGYLIGILIDYRDIID